MLDPKGYYALLGVGPDSPVSAIHAAFRRKAKLLHPDVPTTGNLGAFLRVKEAYEVLSDGLRRNEYDRLARSAQIRTGINAAWDVDYNSPRQWAGYDPPRDEFRASLPPDPPPPEPFVMPIRPLVLVWGSVGLIVVAAICGAVWQLTRPLPVPQYNVSVLSPGAFLAEPPAEPPGIAANPSPGVPHYIQAIAGTATFWRYDDSVHQYRPAGALQAFTPLKMVRLVAHGALAEVQLVLVMP